MALKPVVFPSIYERMSPERTDEEIWRGVETRFDSPAREPQRVASTPLAPPPPDPVREARPTKTIGRQTARRKAPGRTAVNPVAGCKHADRYHIGKSKTPGKVRLRCALCRREETVPESEAPLRVYRARKTG